MLPDSDNSCLSHYGGTNVENHWHCLQVYPHYQKT